MARHLASAPPTNRQAHAEHIARRHGADVERRVRPRQPAHRSEHA